MSVVLDDFLAFMLQMKVSSHADTSQGGNVLEEPKIAKVEAEKTLEASLHY